MGTLLRQTIHAIRPLLQVNIGRPKRLIGSFIGRKYIDFIVFPVWVRFGHFGSKIASPGPGSVLNTF